VKGKITGKKREETQNPSEEELAGVAGILGERTSPRNKKEELGGGWGVGCWGWGWGVGCWGGGWGVYRGRPKRAGKRNRGMWSRRDRRRSGCLGGEETTESSSVSTAGCSNKGARGKGWTS